MDNFNTFLKEADFRIISGGNMIIWWVSVILNVIRGQFTFFWPLQQTKHDSTRHPLLNCNQLNHLKSHVWCCLFSRMYFILSSRTTFIQHPLIHAVSMSNLIKVCRKHTNMSERFIPVSELQRFGEDCLVAVGARWIGFNKIFFTIH